MDSYGHINNVQVLRIVEEARVRALWGAGEPGALPTAVLDPSPEAAVKAVVASTVIEYLAEMPYQADPIDIELWLGKIGGASLEICYELYSPAGATPRTLYARATSTIVTIDGVTGSPARVPDVARHAWADYLEAPIAHRR
jgi:acyl-CoA thioester hydrolase